MIINNNSNDDRNNSNGKHNRNDKNSNNLKQFLSKIKMKKEAVLYSQSRNLPAKDMQEYVSNSTHPTPPTCPRGGRRGGGFGRAGGRDKGLQGFEATVGGGWWWVMVVGGGGGAYGDGADDARGNLFLFALKIRRCCC